MQNGRLLRLGAQPQVGVREIQELKNKFVEKGFQPEENIRTFEGALGYLLGTSPEQLLAACRGLFPLPMKPGFNLCQAWGNFAAWIYAIRREGMSAELAQLGKRLYYQLRAAQAAKETPESTSKPLPMPSGIPERRTTRVFRRLRKRRNIPPLLAMRVVFDVDAQGTTGQLAMCR
ncbi:hypothetical protein DQ04_22891000 [Trypanosoma grayi]|uniref:hypothetical protein n=1 Tax=Trypanosoma grayi TaxID=71804 RepID=UPI0004F4663B|nr:hypothetical protein DQ04_22891000 [Trypanosoma grayi]KEG05366.1 hypothetical protein DQ04_22891000 [Trypanosoma grayi]